MGFGLFYHSTELKWAVLATNFHGGSFVLSKVYGKVVTQDLSHAPCSQAPCRQKHHTALKRRTKGKTRALANNSSHQRKKYDHYKTSRTAAWAAKASHKHKDFPCPLTPPPRQHNPSSSLLSCLSKLSILCNCAYDMAA